MGREDRIYRISINFFNRVCYMLYESGELVELKAFQDEELLVYLEETVVFDDGIYAPGTFLEIVGRSALNKRQCIIRSSWLMELKKKDLRERFALQFANGDIIRKIAETCVENMEEQRQE